MPDHSPRHSTMNLLLKSVCLAVYLLALLHWKPLADAHYRASRAG